jgi:hypothetical protein
MDAARVFHARKAAMTRSRIAALTAGGCMALAGLLSPIPAHAAPPAVQACQAPDGSTLYTDRPCRSIGARAVPIRGELATRIVREQATEARFTGVEVAYVDYQRNTGTMRAARQAIGRRAVAGGCAHTPTQLAMDLRGAFALGDVNRIAESYDWVGMSQRAANATMQRLQKLAKRNVVDAQYYGAQMGGWMATADAGAPMNSGGVMQLQFGDGMSATIQDFDVVQRSGCWFARF